MSYKSKPYREAYPHSIRLFAKQYGVNVYSTFCLNYKVFGVETREILPRCRFLAERNRKRNATITKNFRRMQILCNIAKLKKNETN